jgi:hypothetical protein
VSEDRRQKTDGEKKEGEKMRNGALRSKSISLEERFA